MVHPQEQLLVGKMRYLQLFLCFSILCFCSASCTGSLHTRSLEPGKAKENPPDAPRVLGYSIFLGRAPASQRALADAQGEVKAKEPPIEISVAQAFFEEHILRIKIRLRAKTMLDARELAVAVSGLREGDIVEEQLVCLSDRLQQDMMGEGQSALLDFALRESGLTEYQVRGSWGEDARKILARRRSGVQASAGQGPAMPQVVEASAGKVAVPEGTGMVALNAVDIEEQVLDCPAQPCDLKYIVSAGIENGTPQAVGALKLAIGIYWVTEGLLPEIPAAGAPLSAAEEPIDLGGTVLAPGEKKRIRINVDRAIPVVPGGRFVPHLRLLEFKPANQQ